MKTHTLITVMTIVVFSMLLAGCTTVQKWAAVGGSLGALTGGTLASTNSHELSIIEGAIMGGGTGGLVGALLADNYEKRNLEELEAENENLRMQLEEKNRALSMAQQTDEASVAKLRAEINRLQRKLRDNERALKRAQSRIAELEKQLAGVKPVEYTFTLAESVNFKSNKAELTSEGKGNLRTISDTIKKQFSDKMIMIEGHTDSDAIRAGWTSNWELGAARALAVLHFMTKECGIDGARLSAITYSHYRPVAGNATEAERSKNRRAVVVIVPEMKVTRVDLAK